MQDRPQSSMIRWGGGGQKKYFRGYKYTFPSDLGVMKIKNKKDLYPLLSGHNSRSGGGGTFIAWRGATEAHGADRGSCPQTQE